jgi:hypothetical protein
MLNGFPYPSDLAGRLIDHVVGRNRIDNDLSQADPAVGASLSDPVKKSTSSAAVRVVWDDRNLRHLRERRRCGVPDVEQVIRAICHTARRQRLLVQPGEPVGSRAYR